VIASILDEARRIDAVQIGTGQTGAHSSDHHINTSGRRALPTS